MCAASWNDAFHFGGKRQVRVLYSRLVSVARRAFPGLNTVDLPVNGRSRTHLNMCWVIHDVNVSSFPPRNVNKANRCATWFSKTTSKMCNCQSKSAISHNLLHQSAWNLCTKFLVLGLNFPFIQLFCTFASPNFCTEWNKMPCQNLFMSTHALSGARKHSTFKLAFLLVEMVYLSSVKAITSLERCIHKMITKYKDDMLGSYIQEA